MSSEDGLFANQASFAKGFMPKAGTCLKFSDYTGLGRGPRPTGYRSGLIAYKFLHVSMSPRLPRPRMSGKSGTVVWASF